MRRSSRLATSPSTVVCIASVLVLATLSPAGARDFELSAFAAVRDGGVAFSTGIACIALVGVECPHYGALEDSSRDTWGLAAAMRLAGPWWLDLRWSQEDGEVRFFEDVGLTDPTPGTASMDLAHLHGGVVYRFFDERRWSPFVTAFAGVTRIESRASTTRQATIDMEKASGGLGAGALVDLGSSFGLSLEARQIWTDLPGEFFEDHLEQLEGSARLRYRF